MRITMALRDVFGHIDAHLDESIATLSEFCKIPSISAEKRAQPEAAAFVRKVLGGLGIEGREFPTEGGPNVVFGEYRAGEGRPTLLFYNHYDVQPVDPLEEWKTNPFSPVIEGNKLFARGSGDTKGNLVAQVAAIRAFLAAGEPVPCNVKFVVEGEEEVGSPHFRSFVEANRGILKADGATIEGGEHSMHGVPKVEFGCKGTLYVELTARTAAVDQHSMWAPILPNAAWRLIQALDTMRDREGRILIPGWTKDAMRPTKEMHAYLRKAEFREKELLKAWGIKAPLVKKSGTALLEHAMFSPTCTICGFRSGYQGEGTKTVNPAVASAKVDFRVLPGMKTAKQLAILRGGERRVPPTAGGVAVVPRGLRHGLLQRDRRRPVGERARCELRGERVSRAERAHPDRGLPERCEVLRGVDGEVLALSEENFGDGHPAAGL
ncbi:MAG: M20/M25/M40 family metallo-hydrolase [Methanobacteriota archaeon]|nr:MAG: M20/M25/M40 family metallo-hydrolase [Euryarchaeota archaeon]